MCGITGIFNNTLSINDTESRIYNSIKSLNHRGPDGNGLHVGESFAFGMCRLSILGVTNGKQPFFSRDKKICIVFNGEIYNFQELRVDLQQKGYSFYTDSDSEVIIPLYEEYGDLFVTKLQGMFAIALYDENRQRGLLIRDRLGEKPLWYSSQKNELFFSSEVKGLKSLGFTLTLDKSCLPEYLQFGYINAPRSAFIDVFQVKPGHMLVIEDNHFQEYEYWSLNSALEKYSESIFKHENFELLLEDAVSSRLVSERPIGAFLSGGIDSSIITAIVNRIQGGNICTFSIGFEDEDFDESRYAKLIAQHLGTCHHEKILNSDVSQSIEKLSMSLDMPFADSSIIPTYLLAEFARNEVVVALGGDGGDEVFGGYLRYRMAPALQRVNFLLALLPSRTLYRYVQKSSKIEKLVRSSKFSTLAKRYREMQSLISEEEISQFLEIELPYVENLDYMTAWNSISAKTSLQRLQKFDIATYLPGDLLYKADMATMANSLELRSPFLDYRVVEYGLSLPDDQKLRGSQSKFILRELLSKYIPRELTERPKQGFGIPRSRWIRKELREIVEDTLSSSSFKSRGTFNYPVVQRVLSDHMQGKDLDRIIWPIFMFELWAKNWIDSH
jgi:asparagine synthase (glutamine-hydrolysing)